ncbi:MAG: GntR family transcriptional regulator [Thermovirgaceae bacterium]
MAQDPLSPTRNVDLRQIVYEKIKEAIVEGLIKPGERLSEVELADKLAVSRTPVREAIRQLAQTGLVTLEPRRGAYVALPTVKDASDLYELRAHLEVLAVRLAAKSPPMSLLEKYRALFSSMNEETGTGEYLNEDRRFHAMLYEASKNKYLDTMLKNISDLINLCRHYSVEGLSLTTLADDHVKIIDALRGKNAEKAEHFMRIHLERSREGLLQYLRNHPDETVEGKKNIEGS